MQERVRAFEEWAVDVDREYQSKITLIGQLYTRNPLLLEFAEIPLLL